MNFFSTFRTPRCLATVVSATTLSLLGSIAALSAQSSPELVSISSSGEVGTLDSERPSVSNDARFVVFASRSPNLAAGDTRDNSDIFLRDRITRTTTLISATPAGASGNGDSVGASISLDGRSIAFASTAGDLVAGDENGVRDVFLRDQVSGALECLSVTPDGQPGNGQSGLPGMSRNGRYVAFVSEASNLVEGDTNGVADLFLRDRTLNTTTRLSLNENLEQSLQVAPAISNDGNIVAYTAHEGGVFRAYVRDRSAGSLEVVSLATDGQASTAVNLPLAISSNGRFVAFTSQANNLVANDVNDVQDVFLRDRATGSTELVSVLNGFQTDGPSSNPSLSADGQIIAFDSTARNIGDNNNASDIYIRDRTTETTRLVSVTSLGSQATYGVELPTLSASGRFVAFIARANNWTPGAPQQLASAYVLDTAPQALRATTLTARSLTPSVIQLTWPDTNSAEEGYEIIKVNPNGFVELLTRTPPNATTANGGNVLPGTRYQYRIRPFYRSETGPWSPFATGLTLPAQPFNLEAFNLTSSSVMLRWQDDNPTPLPGILQRRTGTGAFTQVATIPAGRAGGFLHTGLAPNTSYEFRIRLYNDSGPSEYSQLTTATTLPVAATSLEAVARTHNTVTLRWADPNPTKCPARLERRIGNGAYTEIATIPAAQSRGYLDYVLEFNTRYQYRLRLFNDSGFSEYSPVLTVSTLPHEPTNVEIAALTYNSVTFRWYDPNPTKLPIHLERRIGNQPFEEVVTVPAASSNGYHHADLTPNTRYQFRFRFITSSGPSAYSPLLYVTTPPLPPPAPATITPVVSGNRVILSWSTAVGATSYRVRRTTERGGPYAVVAEGLTAARYIDEAVMAGGTYYYVVTGVNAGGESAFSPEAAAVIPSGIQQ